ncbi:MULTISPECIES: hypothetical protein [unclassified Actinotalea]|uniref:hypothetical protein n=1 Tax=unclassified Actinotalea TaxID=2638618 RepID=UPI0015F67FCF|nr:MULTISPECIES: hypothetical protein [unclassified Actinotalea]
MTDTDDEVARARAALGGAPVAADPEILGAVHEGLLAVPTEPVAASAEPTGGAQATPVEAATSSLAVRRR